MAEYWARTYDLGYLDGRSDAARELARMLAARAVESGAIHPDDLSDAIGEATARGRSARVGLPQVPTDEETLDALLARKRSGGER